MTMSSHITTPSNSLRTSRSANLQFCLAHHTA